MNNHGLWKEASIDSRFKWPSRYGIERQSYCELELDAWVSDIMNRSNIRERKRKPLIDLVNGTLNLGSTKLVPSLAAMWQVKIETNTIVVAARCDSVTLKIVNRHFVVRMRRSVVEQKECRAICLRIRAP